MDSGKKKRKKRAFAQCTALNLPFESGEMELDITLDMCISGWVKARRSDLTRKKDVFTSPKARRMHSKEVNQRCVFNG